LSAFRDVLHLHHPIVKDVATGITVLESLVAEMERRYELGEEVCQRLPFLICIIDEFDDTIANIVNKDDAKKFTAALDSLIRRARKAKIVLVLASHHPTIKTTGINVNGIDSRIAFRVLKHQNSSTSIGVAGADKLPGNGAMIFKTPGKTEHLQGAWVTKEEVVQILSTKPEGFGDIETLKIVEPEMLRFPPAEEEAVVLNAAMDKANKELAHIAFGVLGMKKVSANMLQKEARMGKRANDVIDMLHKMGLVSEKFSNQPRSVAPKCYEDLSPETVAFFEHHGYTTEQIQDKFYTADGTQEAER